MVDECPWHEIGLTDKWEVELVCSCKFADLYPDIGVSGGIHLRLDEITVQRAINLARAGIHQR